MSINNSDINKGRSSVPAILSTYTIADHRKRLENIALCEHGIRKYMRKHFIRDYIPGHCVYQARSSEMQPTEADDTALARLEEDGIGLIQIWSNWWNNPWGGRPMYQAANPQGLREFVDLVHRHGMKIIPYTSTNFYERTDPNFRPEWALAEYTDLVEYSYHLAHCSLASPGWREQMLSSMVRILDEYGFDGLYNDMGYHRTCDYIMWRRYYEQYPKLAEDEIIAFEESDTHDGAVQDALGLIYSEVKRRGGIYKLHKEGFDRVHTDFPVYDYLWVGEAVQGMELLREKVKNYDPYIIPEYSSKFELKNENDLYLNSIPYLQFPVLRLARTGGKLENRKTHADWLKQYMPMVEEGTWAWLDIHDADLFQKPLPSDIVVSAFANRNLYIVLANMGDTPASIVMKDEYASAENLQEPAKRTWELQGHTLGIICRREP